MTSADTAVHYIPKSSQAHGTGRTRRVTMGKELSVQVQIILTGDDDEDEVGEAYEEWKEEMAEDDDDDYEEDTTLEDGEGIGEDQDEGERRQRNNSGGVRPPNHLLQDRASHQEPEMRVTAAALPSSNNSTIDKRLSGTSSGPFWRIFSRSSKKENAKGNNARVSDDADSRSITSLASSVTSEDRTPIQSADSQLTVLRVFAGNINVRATYHSLLVNEHTSAEQLLVQAMERFHIAQIEGKTAGRSLRSITPTQGSGVEYYLTVKAMNGGMLYK